MRVKIVIEHLEDRYSLWLLYEYINASTLVGRDNIIYSNIKSSRVRRILSRYGLVLDYRIGSVVREEDMIILDPSAPKTIEQRDIKYNTYIVVGGILGTDPPLGRTRELLTGRYRGAKARNIGDKQFSIDGAVYVAYMLLNGFDLHDIEYIDDLTIQSEYSVVRLPYRYPLKDGIPIISKTIKTILPVEGPFSLYWTRKLD
ncbi:hypothetical protein DRN84_01600 [Candidatus Geothermarchaeota archaeon]|nr:MAG: hypothetical protein DRN87_04460 [Candidatus Geothermarchaeota archaeon]RLG62551.1 MAG: hypothetical protein DRN84_01600 [Candidatus Geothermarchaeota archaeon]HEW93851.1 hypothetical protein [Thermoprotei archaeon]